MDLNARMNRFRHASRELFNHYFHPSTYGANASENASIAGEPFLLIEEQLFQALVTDPARLEAIRYGQCQPGIIACLRAGDFAPWMLNREIDSGYWDHALGQFTGDALLQFVTYFDWDQADFKDHRYVHVRIAQWPAHPELVGKHALVESMYLQFAPMCVTPT